MTDNSYLPVSWDFREILAESKAAGKSSKIHYFDATLNIYADEGAIKEIIEIKDEGEFLILESGNSIRLDRIITLYGIPGPAFDIYDSFANACLDCTGGYEL
jgi:hypothetical protein